MQYTTVYKWERNIDNSWGLSEQELLALDLSAWTHNGWTECIPECPPIYPEQPSGRSKKTTETL
jgi:hypothetical protein